MGRLLEWPEVGLDVYHVWWDPDLARQVARAQGRIALFQASDWLAPTAEFAPDRGTPVEMPDLAGCVRKGDELVRASDETRRFWYVCRRDA